MTLPATESKIGIIQMDGTASGFPRKLNCDWSDSHITDFQVLRPVVLRNRFSPETVASIHALGEQAIKGNCCDKIGSSFHWKYYLQAGGFCHKINPNLVAELRSAMEAADKVEWGLLEEEKVTVRLLEYHTYLKGGCLTDGWYRHYDGGSLLTMVVMLSDPAVDFEGGRLVVSDPDQWEADGSFIDAGLTNPGDCVVFPSHKYHNVSVVTKGKRHVAVMELWNEHQGFEDNRPGNVVLLEDQTTQLFDCSMASYDSYSYDQQEVVTEVGEFPVIL